MKLIKPKPGKYVVAVSGGVDSVVLLDMLAQQADLELVVAHFDHGIRPDSAADAKFVSEQAVRYGLPFVTESAELGPQASEATARQARYAFLRRAQKQHEAKAIITAHHQDDVLETAIFNLLRGTGRRGLASLSSTKEIVRPLLDTPKTAIKDHGLQRKLSWREDTTNHDERYARNYIRHRLLVRFDADARQQLLALIARQQQLNTEIDVLLNRLLDEHDEELPRKWFAQLTHDVAKETMALWLRKHQLTDYDKHLLERLTVQSKTRQAGKQLDVLHGRQLVVGSDRLTLL